MTETPTLDLAELERLADYSDHFVGVDKPQLRTLIAAAKERDELRALLVRAGEAMKEADGAINAAYQQVQAEYQGYDIRADNFEKVVFQFRERARHLAAAITRATQTDITDTEARDA